MFNPHKFVYWVRSLPISLFMYLKKQYKIAMILLCPVQGPWASSFVVVVIFCLVSSSVLTCIPTVHLLYLFFFFINILSGKWMSHFPFFSVSPLKTVTKILKKCTYHNCWSTSYSMIFSVIYVTADTLQVKPVYVTLRNPILNWLRGSRTCIDDDQH